jgi:large subunit ribosomal protein L29
MFPFGSQQIADEEPFHHPRKETGILKIEEIRGLKEADLGRKAEELRRERFQLRVQQQTGQLEKPNRLREIRRTLARIETAKTEVKLASASKGKK